MVHVGLCSEGFASAPKTVGSVVAEDAARAHLRRVLAARKADVPVVAVATLSMSPDAVWVPWSPMTPAVVGGTRKRKGTDHDGVGGIAQGRHKKARAPRRTCEHGKETSACKVPFVRPASTLRPSPQTLLPAPCSLQPGPQAP